MEKLFDQASPVYKYISREDFSRIASEVRQNRTLKGRQLVIDTRDQEQCAEVERQINQSGARKNSNLPEDSLCRIDPTSPFISVTIFEEVRPEDLQLEINLSPLTTTERNLFTETRNLTIGAMGFAGLLYLLPQSITKWDKSKTSNTVLDKYKSNVRSGPIRDKDHWAINYIGHPIAGATYYQVARNLNLSPFQSFGYSVIMSTFFWEYGIESFAEKPSTQDLWITPILGSILGELFFQMGQSIKNKNGTVLGSERLGNFVMVLLNPAGSLSNQINKLLGSRFVQESRLHLTSLPAVCRRSSGITEDCRSPGVGLRLEFKF